MSQSNDPQQGANEKDEKDNEQKDKYQQLEHTFQMQNNSQRNETETKSQVNQPQTSEGNNNSSVHEQQQKSNSQVIQNNQENQKETQQPTQGGKGVNKQKTQEEQKNNSEKLIEDEKKTSQNQDNSKQTDRKNTKRRTTKKQTTKVEFQDPPETKQSNQQSSEQNVENIESTQEPAESGKPTQQEIEKQQKEEEEQKRLQEQQEQLQKSQLKERFLKSLIYPSKKSNSKKEKLYQTLIISFEKEESVPRRKCKSEIKFRREKKQRSRSSIIKDLIDFYNKMNPEKPKVENIEEVEKYKQLHELQKDLDNFEQQESFSQPQKPKRKISKQRSSTQPKKKVELIIVHKQVRKAKVRNGLKDRMKIDKDRDKQLAALEFIKKMQQTRIDAEKKRQEHVQNLGNKIAEEIEVIRLGNRAYREEVQQKKRKQALEKITKHEQKRYEQMMKQEQNEKFVRELRDKVAALGHYSAKKLISPSSLVTELENGGIAIEQNIDSYRKLNENQFVLLEEQKIIKKLNKKKQMEYGKQVSLFHLPKVGVQKKSPKEYDQNHEPLPEIKPKQKKAWQIEQELNQKKQQHQEIES